uniref:7TM GPCR domain containing protein n=1 Tax=Haemonchus contortus TaxID=6289 RepID=A0A7I4YYU8_HAECO
MQGGADPIKMAVFIESLIMLLCVAQVSPFCALQIHRSLKSNLLSRRTKEAHRKMLILLSIQIICPMLLMNLPLSMMYFMFFTGIESPVILNYFSGIAMALYPLVTPIITILFVKDYRKQCLVTLHVIDKPPASVLPVTTTF